MSVCRHPPWVRLRFVGHPRVAGATLSIGRSVPGFRAVTVGVVDLTRWDQPA